MQMDGLWNIQFIGRGQERRYHSNDGSYSIQYRQTDNQRRRISQELTKENAGLSISFYN